MSPNRRAAADTAVSERLCFPARAVIGPPRTTWGGRAGSAWRLRICHRMTAAAGRITDVLRPAPWLAAAVLTALPAVADEPAGDSAGAVDDFGHRLVAAIAQRDAPFITEHMDTTALDHLVPDSAPTPESEAVLTAFRSMLKMTGDLLLKEWPANAHSKLIRTIDSGDTVRYRIRTDSDEGTGYVDILVAERSGRKLIVDWYAFMTHTRFSESLRSIMEIVVSELGTSAGSDETGGGTIPPILLAANMIRTGNHAGAWGVLKDLPSSVRKRPLVVAMKIQIALGIDSKTSNEILESIDRDFGPRSPYALALIDYYFGNEEHADAEKAVETLIEAVGPDSRLCQIAGNLALVQEEYRKAVGHFHDGLRIDPDDEDLYYSAMDVLVKMGYYADVLTAMDILAMKFGVEWDMDAFMDIRGYEGFARSRELKQWMREEGL